MCAKTSTRHQKRRETAQAENFRVARNAWIQACRQTVRLNSQSGLATPLPLESCSFRPVALRLRLSPDLPFQVSPDKARKLTTMQVHRRLKLQMVANCIPVTRARGTTLQIRRYRLQPAYVRNIRFRIAAVFQQVACQPIISFLLTISYG